ncbi:alpha/beta hydrolase [Streptomyces sp. NPDC051917]|uniref:alpha/beta hydrolase family protein n=1 Tax=Streptomyces sp. NPDC051917 TaxID=3154754 RepID=UPI00344F9F18
MPRTAPSPARTSGSLMSECIYYLPRLMFLNSRYAPQTHWGDIATVLRDFPEDSSDVGSPRFWDEWQSRWIAHGERYGELARNSSTTAGRIRAERSAAVCYHWAEFMDFGDRQRKLRLRSQVREHFLRSLKGSELPVEQGELTVATGTGETPCRVPYWLFLPPSPRAGTQPVPCVIMSNGLDSMTEVEVLALAESYLERGIAALLFDGPGQGIHVGQVPLLVQVESVVAELVAVLRRDPRIADDRLAFFGISFGGYFTLRMAQHLGSLFTCLVNLSGGPRIAPFDGLPRRLKDDFRFVFACGEPVDMQARFDALEIDLTVPAGAPVLSVHGDRDDIFPVTALKELDRAWGGKHRLVVHENEAHICPNLVNLWSIDAADWVADQLRPA